MAADYAIQYPCEPRLKLGDGDAAAGTERLLYAIQARDRAAAVAKQAKKKGDDLAQVMIRLHVTWRGEDVDEGVSYTELFARSAVLKEHEGACANCPANMHKDRPFGCFGHVPYPIEKAGEAWLMDRLQPPDTVGGKLLRSMIRDFKYTGEPIQGLRRTKHFEARKPVQRSFKTGILPPDVINSNQVFQALFGVGEELSPGHALCLLLWFGGLTLDGKPIRTPEEAAQIKELDTPDMRSDVILDLGEPCREADIGSLQQLIAALYYAWVCDVPLWISV